MGDKCRRKKSVDTHRFLLAWMGNLDASTGEHDKPGPNGTDSWVDPEVSVLQRLVEQLRILTFAAL